MEPIVVTYSPGSWIQFSSRRYSCNNDLESFKFSFKMCGCKRWETQTTSNIYLVSSDKAKNKCIYLI
jgi:hypothetical protein